MDITVEAVPLAGKPVIARLLELYMYDFSEYMGWDVDAEGRYGYRRLDCYWTEGNRFPFLVRVDGAIAGFALVYVGEDDGAPVTHMAEFFVMRKYRRHGVGRIVATTVFDRFPGIWHVSQLQENVPAQRFWRSVIAGYTGGEFTGTVTDRRVIQTFRVAPTGD